MKPLQTFVEEVRAFLEPHWIKAHESWADEPAPYPPSKFMCRYSCLFLKQVLQENGYGEWEIFLGRPDREKNGTAEGVYGFKSTEGAWHDHAWLVKGDILIDITADQFSDMPVKVIAACTVSYKANLTEIEAHEELEELKKRVRLWIKAWAR